MAPDYTVAIVARNEGLEYREADLVCQFNLARNGNTWTVFLPGTFGEDLERRQLPSDERNRIVPRIEQYLAKATWRAFFGGRAIVQFAQEPPFDFQAMLNDEERRGRKIVRHSDGTATVFPNGKRTSA
jgi:hypothetical protein